ncbi:MAG: TlpA disulfide reductase family protein [Steroidobacteraceae bacterium]
MKKGVMIVVAIAIAAAAGFFAQRKLQDAPGHVATSAPVPPASSQAAPGPDAPQPEAKVPDVLPAFELADRDGRKRKLSDWAGQPVMVNFWATWCGPCRREIPLLNKVHAARAPQKVEIIGVAVDFRDDVLAYAQKTPISYPLLIGEEDGLAAVQAFGMQPNFPFTAFADSKQRLVALKIGELHQEEIDLILDRVLAVDAGKLDLPAAREQISEGLKQIATQRAAEAAKSPKLAAN